MTRVAYPFIDRETVGRNLREAALQSKKSFRAIANEAHVNDSHLNRFFKHGTGISPDGIERIAKVLGTDVRKIYSTSA